MTVASHLEVRGYAGILPLPFGEKGWGEGVFEAIERLQDQPIWARCLKR